MTTLVNINLGSVTGNDYWITVRPQYNITDTGAAYLAFCQKHSVPSDNVQSQTVLKLLYISKAYICLGCIYIYGAHCRIFVVR